MQKRQKQKASKQMKTAAKKRDGALASFAGGGISSTHHLIRKTVAGGQGTTGAFAQSGGRWGLSP